MPFFRANFFFGGLNLQKNKTKDFTVTVTGKADITSLPEYEKRIFCSALLSRITELMRGGDE